MGIIDKYLDEIQNLESIFPMDSIHSGTLPSKYVITGDDENSEDEIDTHHTKHKGDKYNRRNKIWKALSLTYLEI